MPTYSAHRNKPDQRRREATCDMISIGVITPTYNRPDLLRSLHLSISTSTDSTTWKHYVVDDGSVADYEPVVDELSSRVNHLVYHRIENSGPLVARNRAIDIAMKDGCDFLCFLDDDDHLLEPGLDAVISAASANSDCDWLIFHSKKNGENFVDSMSPPKKVDWLQDAILKRTVPSDSFCVVSSKIIGQTRFSEKKTRNQREWTFFLELHKKKPRILLFSSALQGKTYLDDGLTAQSDRGTYSAEQLANNVERAYRYWLAAPTNAKLIVNLARQVIGFPLKTTLGRWRSKNRETT